MKTQPDDWQRVKLGDCCEIVSGATPRRIIPEYWNGNIPWVTPKDISKLIGPVLQDSPEKITQSGYENCSTTLLPKGSILFSSRAPIGLVAIAGKSMCTNQGFKSLIPNSSVYSGYLYWCMKHHANEVAVKGNGTTFKEVSRSVMNDFTIPLPPLKEQKRIAAILDKADVVRRKRQESIRLTEEFLKSVFLDMFGDPVTNPKGWPTKQIGEICIVTTGNTPSRSNPNYYGDHIEWIKSDNVNTKDHILTTAKEGLSKAGMAVGRTVESGSILVTCIAGSRSSIGKVAIVDRRIAFNQQINALTPNPKIEYRFLYTNMLLAKKLIQTVSTDSMKGLVSKGRLQKVRLPVPPTSKQKAFSIVFAQLLELKRYIDQVGSESAILFNSLVQRAFKGEL